MDKQLLLKDLDEMWESTPKDEQDKMDFIAAWGLVKCVCINDGSELYKKLENMYLQFSNE